MIGIFIAAAVLTLYFRTRNRPRIHFAFELLITYAIGHLILDAHGWPWWLRAGALLVWPWQMQDLRIGARRAGVVCLLIKHDPEKRMLVDSRGRRIGVLSCSSTDPEHTHPLPPGLTALPAACRRCRKEAVA